MPLFYSASKETLGTMQFERLGHPGRYTHCLKHAGGITHFTGSNYGYGALMIGSGSITTDNEGAQLASYIRLSGGGDTIPLSELAFLKKSTEYVNAIHELSVFEISSSIAGAPVYFFKRQQ